MNKPVDPPFRKLCHHHLWSSRVSWKYSRDTVMNEVTRLSITKARNKIPKRVYILWPHMDAKM